MGHQRTSSWPIQGDPVCKVTIFFWRGIHSTDCQYKKVHFVHQAFLFLDVFSLLHELKYHMEIAVIDAVLPNILLALLDQPNWHKLKDLTSLFSNTVLFSFCRWTVEAHVGLPTTILVPKLPELLLIITTECSGVHKFAYTIVLDCHVGEDVGWHLSSP